MGLITYKGVLDMFVGASYVRTEKEGTCFGFDRITIMERVLSHTTERKRKDEDYKKITVTGCYYTLHCLVTSNVANEVYSWEISEDELSHHCLVTSNVANEVDSWEISEDELSQEICSGYYKLVLDKDPSL
tara:strand:+ start:1567 stop:1959 length:393 start_codon:yes stop_codon:yes gene_type:complete